MWLEALERLTLSFCLTIPVLICEGATRGSRSRRPCSTPLLPPLSSLLLRPGVGFLTAISSGDFKSLGRVAVYQERRIADRIGDTHVFHTHAHAIARAYEREMIGKFDFPGQLMLL